MTSLVNYRKGHGSFVCRIAEMEMLRRAEKDAAVRYGLAFFQKLVGNIFLVNICFRELGFSGPYRRKGRYRQFLFFFSLHDSVCLAESPYHLDFFLFHGLVCHTERH